MKIWVDAQLPPALCKWLDSEFGLDATPVRSLGLRDAKDPDVFRAARDAGVVIMSKDADFAQLVRVHGAPPQVLWVTCGNTSNEGLRAFLGATLRSALDLIEAGEPLVRVADSPGRTSLSRGSEWTLLQAAAAAAYRDAP